MIKIASIDMRRHEATRADNRNFAVKKNLAEQMGQAQPNRQLESWKEIAVYLGKDERTVQRWERDRGLPVHRLPGNRSNVFTYTQELDAWRNGQRLQNEPEASIENGSPVLIRTQREPDDALKDRASEHGPEGSYLTARDQEGDPAKRPRGKFKLVAASLVLVVVASAYLTLRKSVAPSTVPTRVAYGARSLTAYGAKGEILWTFEFPGTLIQLVPEGRPEMYQTRILDFDGDGEVEILSVAAWQVRDNPGGQFESQLFRFSARGELLQQFSPTDSVSFAGTQYGRPWTVRSFLFTEEQGKHFVWLACTHLTWWPTLLVKLDGYGREIARFTHAGWIQSLASLQTEQGTFLLAGGINNEHSAAMLAVLNATNPSGTGPAPSDRKYACDNCPAGQPYRYFVFPRSELAITSGLPYNQVIRITPNEKGFYAFTEETAERNNILYEFSRDFRLLGVSMSDYYWSFHDQLFRNGKVDHPASACPERRRPPLPLEWRDNAWQEVRPVARPQ